jgi:hypothetical protein
MRIELSDGELLELSHHEARNLYEILLERLPHGATSVAGKLRSALAWPSGGTRVTLGRLETEAVRASQADKARG